MQHVIKELPPLKMPLKVPRIATNLSCCTLAVSSGQLQYAVGKRPTGSSIRLY